MKKILRELFGGYNARTLKKEGQYQRTYACTYKDIEYLDESLADQKPIFIFSAGWRCGSTLLQRLICSKENILMWGEPYDRSNTIQYLSSIMSPISDSWPLKSYFLKNYKDKKIAENWVANLYPELTSMKQAHSQFFKSLFIEPVTKNGYTRWGIKEVRWGAKEALYLKWLFPNAKFLFLNRDVVSSFSSYKKFSENINWFSEWPDKDVFTARKFAKHNKRLVREFDFVCEEVNGLKVDYQSLIDNSSVLDEISNYCELEIDKAILKRKIGQGKEVSVRKLSIIDRLQLKYCS